MLWVPPTTLHYNNLLVLLVPHLCMRPATPIRPETPIVSATKKRKFLLPSLIPPLSAELSPVRLGRFFIVIHTYPAYSLLFRLFGLQLQILIISISKTLFCSTTLG